MIPCRCEILVKKAFRDGFTWADIESFFCINRNFLKEEITRILLGLPKGEEKLKILSLQLERNEKCASAYER